MTLRSFRLPCIDFSSVSMEHLLIVLFMIRIESWRTSEVFRGRALAALPMAESSGNFNGGDKNSQSVLTDTFYAISCCISGKQNT